MSARVCLGDHKTLHIFWVLDHAAMKNGLATVMVVEARVRDSIA